MNEQAEDRELVKALTPIVREADEQFEKDGGGTRHWLRDCFLPCLNAAGFRIERG